MTETRSPSECWARTKVWCDIAHVGSLSLHGLSVFSPRRPSSHPKPLQCPSSLASPSARIALSPKAISTALGTRAAPN